MFKLNFGFKADLLQSENIYIFKFLEHIYQIQTLNCDQTCIDVKVAH